MVFYIFKSKAKKYFNIFLNIKIILKISCIAIPNTLIRYVWDCNSSYKK
jgi:hypothetical protein